MLQELINETWNNQGRRAAGHTEASNALNSWSLAFLYSSISLDASVRASLSFCTRSMKRLESSNPGFLQAQAYTGGLVERSWKLPFRPLTVFGSLEIVEPP